MVYPWPNEGEGITCSREESCELLWANTAAGGGCSVQEQESAWSTNSTKYIWRRGAFQRCVNPDPWKR